MKTQEQLDLWVEGNSVHNQETNECCPDFSCCVPSINTSQDRKLKFQDAYLQGKDDVVESLLMEFLNNLLIVRGYKVDE